MARYVSPPRESLDTLRQPLTPGERMVFDFFDQNLAPSWEIYIQPHMNGLRPDFVLLNPNVGMAIFEVKDWNLDAMDYHTQTFGRAVPKLLATRGGETFSLQKDNPIEKIHQYKQELFNLYCPRLQKQNGFAAITAGVIFPFADDNRVRSLFQASMDVRGMLKYPQYTPISGRNSLACGDIESVFPESKRTYSRYMTPALADDLRFWLREPDFSAEQRRPLELDSNQKALVTSRTESGYRRIKGSAGSGKSLVLAARAAELIAQDKEVLVVTFNITLLHYLMDVSVRWGDGGGRTRSNVTWLNFHNWCKRICCDAGYKEEYDNLWMNDEAPNYILNERLPALVNSIIDNEPESVTKFDAILVDEGQDFMPHWWNLLRKVCNPDGEMLLVADATQDIYETAQAWTDEAMKGAGFSGPWSTLEVSYRMPKQALDYARAFAMHYLPKEDMNLPSNNQSALDLEPAHLRWVQTIQQDAVEVCKDEVFRFFSSEQVEELSIAETTFLCGKKQFGLDVVAMLGKFGIRTVHTFDRDEQESRRQKLGFYMGNARVKATTLHSFKGWESRLLVVYVDDATSIKDLALIYIGLTRLKRSMKGSALTVVSTSEILRSYGETWPDFEDKSPEIVL